MRSFCVEKQFECLWSGEARGELKVEELRLLSNW
jgi:hypothetical protein